MKKLLALVLALVMTLSLCVTSNAAYSDAADVDYKEAVDVLSAVGVFVGDGSGKFDPDGALNRAAAAKLVAYLTLGQKAADALEGAGTVFTDVPASHWAAGYIEYCASAGYLAGVGDGKFDPAGELTGAAFAKLMLCCLGYDANTEGYVGANWSINVVKKANALDLFADEDKSVNAVVTRQEAAQMMLNTIESTVVFYNGGSSITINDVTFKQGATLTVADGTSGYGDWDSGNMNWYGTSFGTVTSLELGEFLYGTKLKPVTATTEDDFGRTAIKWFYNAKGTATTASKYLVGTYAVDADFTYLVTSTKTTPNMLAVLDELGVGVASSLNKTTLKAAAVAVGDTIEVYTNTDGDANGYNVFKTVLAKVTKVAAASKDADYDYTVTLKTASTTKSFKDTDLTGFDADTMVKDTYVTYTTVSGKTGVAVAVADKVTGKVTGSGSNYVKVDGDKKTTVNPWDVDSATFTGDYTNTFDFYLDANGYVIGAVKVTDINTIDNIFFVSEANFKKGNSFADDKAQLKVYYLDGTTKVINMTIDSDKKVDIGPKTALPTTAGDLGVAGKFYAYTMDGEKVSKITMIADGVVKNTTQLVAANKDVVFTAKEPVVTIDSTKFYASSTTKIVMIDTDGKATTITGYSKLPAATYTTTATPSKIAAAGYLYVADKTDLKELYIVGAAERVGAVDTAVYGYYVDNLGNNYNNEDKVLETTLVFNVDGTDTEYKIKNADLASYEGLYNLEVKDGYVAITNTGVIAFANIESVGDGYVVIGSSVVKLADTCGIYDATDTDAIAEGTLNKGDIVSYTTSDSKINRIYVGYAAQDDGIIVGEDTTAYEKYLHDVLGYTTGTDAAYHAGLGSDGIVVKFTLDAALNGTLTVDVKNTSVDPATTFTYNFGSVNWLKDETHSVMIDLLNDYSINHSGDEYPVGNYEVVVKIGTTEVASYTFSVEA